MAELGRIGGTPGEERLGNTGWLCSSSSARETSRYEVRAAQGRPRNGVLQVVMRETWRDFIAPLMDEALFCVLTLPSQLFILFVRF